MGESGTCAPPERHPLTRGILAVGLTCLLVLNFQSVSRTPPPPPPPAPMPPGFPPPMNCCRPPSNYYAAFYGWPFKAVAWGHEFECHVGYLLANMAVGACFAGWVLFRGCWQPMDKHAGRFGLLAAVAAMVVAGVVLGLNLKCEGWPLPWRLERACIPEYGWAVWNDGVPPVVNAVAALTAIVLAARLSEYLHRRRHAAWQPETEEA